VVRATAASATASDQASPENKKARDFNSVMALAYSITRVTKRPNHSIELVSLTNSREKGSSEGKLRRKMTGSYSRSTAYRFVRTIARVKPRPSEIDPNLFRRSRDTQ
jgi:predicted amidophosphoribosyltransferase